MTAEKLLDIARAEIGITEDPPNSNNVKYNTWYYDREVSGNDYPWCMAFVQWCFDQAGIPLLYKTASCSELLNWYRRHIPERVVTVPLPGDIIIFTFGHTGIVESVTSSGVIAIEGNTSEVGSQNNGGRVCRKARLRESVRAYIRPCDFSDDEEDDDEPPAEEEPPVKSYEEDEDMDVNRFRELWLEMRKELQDNDAGDWSAEAREWATSTGLIKGDSFMEDGTPNYIWEDLLTREQFITVLYRFARMMGMA